ncbi:MAG TPA: hypothetical protein ENK66_03645 [Arcobacter sp.]|jgi:chromosome segregation ATPase|nr:hypothetical protein [Arcobacter sp.]
MINKLYKLKKTQLDQKLASKKDLESKQFSLEKEIIEIQTNLSQSGVKMFGSISDFKILAIHKNTMKNELEKMQYQKGLLNKRIETINLAIIEVNKELEQYKYILDLQKQEEIKQMRKKEELVASEYVQAKWMAQ